ncbi:11651_t:CDS:2, partial [Scutellospora calospora]
MNIYKQVNLRYLRNRITFKARGGDRRLKLNDDHRLFLRRQMEINPSITINELYQKLIEQFNLQVIRSTVGQNIKKLGFTLKRLVPINESQNIDTTIVQRKEYVDNIFQENIDMYNDVIYINECGFNLHLTHSRGHASSRKSAIKEVVKQRSKNITIIAAIDGNSIIKVSSNLAYSPFLNPIEKAFSKVKNLVARHYLTDRETILGRIDDAFDMVTREDCRNWIRHSISYFDSCQDEERIE